MKTNVFLSVVLLALACLTGWAAHAQSTVASVPSQTWEYQEVQLSARVEATPLLNRLGA